MCISAGRDLVPINCSTGLIEKGSALANGIGSGLAVRPNRINYRFSRYYRPVVATARPVVAPARPAGTTARDPVCVCADVGNPEDACLFHVSGFRLGKCKRSNACAQEADNQWFHRLCFIGMAMF